MSKIFKDEKIFNNFKKQFEQIFKDKNFIEMTANHFNKNGSFTVVILGLLQNRIGSSKIIENVKINIDEWLEMLTSLYHDVNIKNAYDKLCLNPWIKLENVVAHFKVFENFSNKIWSYCQGQNWDLNIAKNDFVELICNCFGYLMYNAIDCKINYDLSDILQDPKYDKKYTMILNNTKLFAQAKSCILKHCELKVNDLIVLLLGGSNHLSLDK